MFRFQTAHIATEVLTPREMALQDKGIEQGERIAGLQMRDGAFWFERIEGTDVQGIRAGVA